MVGLRWAGEAELIRPPVADVRIEDEIQVCAGNFLPPPSRAKLASTP
jgi:hypothetical protein